MLFLVSPEIGVRISRSITVRRRGPRVYCSHTTQIMKRKNASINETQPSRNVDKQVFNAAGVLLQFLASPEEVGDAICLIRGTMPPGVVVPLHKHAEVELLYFLRARLNSSWRRKEPNGQRP